MISAATDVNTTRVSSPISWPIPARPTESDRDRPRSSDYDDTSDSGRECGPQPTKMSRSASSYDDDERTEPGTARRARSERADDRDGIAAVTRSDDFETRCDSTQKWGSVAPQKPTRTVSVIEPVTDEEEKCKLLRARAGATRSCGAKSKTHDEEIGRMWALIADEHEEPPIDAEGGPMTHRPVTTVTDVEEKRKLLRAVLAAVESIRPPTPRRQETEELEPGPHRLEAQAQGGDQSAEDRGSRVAQTLRKAADAETKHRADTPEPGVRVRQSDDDSTEKEDSPMSEGELLDLVAEMSPTGQDYATRDSRGPRTDFTARRVRRASFASCAP